LLISFEALHYRTTWSEQQMTTALITKHSKSGPRSRLIHAYIPPEEENLLKALDVLFTNAHGARVSQSLIIRSALWRLAKAIKTGEHPPLPPVGKTMVRHEKDTA
jgi:hypothetical protein